MTDLILTPEYYGLIRPFARRKGRQFTEVRGTIIGCGLVGDWLFSGWKLFIEWATTRNLFSIDLE